MVSIGWWLVVVVGSIACLVFDGVVVGCCALSAWFGLLAGGVFWFGY